MRFPGGFGVVRHHDDRLPDVPVQSIEQSKYLLGGRTVEVAGRFVGDDDRRSVMTPARSYALLLPASSFGW